MDTKPQGDFSKSLLLCSGFNSHIQVLKYQSWMLFLEEKPKQQCPIYPSIKVGAVCSRMIWRRRPCRLLELGGRLQKCTSTYRLKWLRSTHSGQSRLPHIKHTHAHIGNCCQTLQLKWTLAANSLLLCRMAESWHVTSVFALTSKTTTRWMSGSLWDDGNAIEMKTGCLPQCPATHNEDIVAV